MRREFVVGTVFFVLMALLLGMTLWIKDPDFIGGGPTHELKAQFRDVAGLEVGNDVRVYGAKAGRVLAIDPGVAGHVLVTMALDYDPQLREDYELSVSPSSALGGTIVSIHPGDPASAEITTDVLEGRSTEPSLLPASLVEKAERALETFDQAGADLRDAIAALTPEEGAPLHVLMHDKQLATDLKDGVADIRSAAAKLERGEGTLGKLLNDDSLHSDLKAAVASLKVDEGSAVDLLLHDKALAADLKESVTNVRSVTAKLDAGTGSLGRLLNDPSLYDDLAATAADLREVAAAARSGQGAFGKLLYDEELGQRIDRISKDVAQVTGRLRRGEGALGKLIQDEELYVELRDSLKALTAGAGDARENAPILTFASFLFGGF